MPTVDFTKSELIEISDAISEVLRRKISERDKERDELRYGMLTLLHEAQAKILPVAFGFTCINSCILKTRAWFWVRLRKPSMCKTYTHRCASW